MKKQITLLLFIITTVAFSQNTYVPDDNFEQALIDLGYDTLPLDDYVPTANINNVTSLIISNKNIVDLTGIEDFTVIQYLQCSDNLLTSIDISQNSSLTTLFCYNNSLTDIDVTNNPNLLSLNCSNNNMTVIDVSQNPNIVTLDCSNNMISSLDLNQNLSLSNFNCSNNSIETLNLSINSNLGIIRCYSNNLSYLNVKNGNNTSVNVFDAQFNPNLTCIEVDDAAYSTANWTFIDAQCYFSEDCTVEAYVPDDNFEQALIDLGYDTVLDDYVLIANISAVVTLDISNNNITDLTGIEYFSSLETLNCNGNSLTSPDFSQNTTLTQLYCSNNQLTSINLSGNPNLTLFQCNGNNLTSIDLSQNTLLESLLISNNLLSSLDVIQNDNLQIFDCSNNQIQILDLTLNSSLINLNCSNNALTELNLKSTSNTLITSFNALNNPNLTCIEVDDPVYSTANWTNIDPQMYFSTDCSLGLTFVPDDNFEQELINLGYDAVLDDYVPTGNINGVLTLNLLNLNINDFTGIEDFENLETLYSANNPASNLDVSQNSSLQSLICYNMNLTNLDISNNSDLLILSCGGNQLTSLDVSQNLNLEKLYCNNNLLSTLDVSNNINLTELYCDSNNLFELILDQNTNLIKLNCQINNLYILNVKNGNNTIITEFIAVGNPQLNCIEVDDPAYSSANWTNIDPQSYFDANCPAIELTYIPDDNFEQALINLGYDVAPLDDLIPTNTVNSITNLDISNLNIADLTGIEDFTALQNLNVSNNTLTSLDLSQNLNLQNLLCQNNAIELLNLSQNTNLINLKCQNNALTELNIKNGNNTNITNNNFVAVNNPNLTCIFVDDATWSTDNWTNIDPSSTFVETQAQCNTLAVDNVSFANEVKIYPNPTNTVFKINTTYSLSKIELFNYLGKKVKAFTPQESYNIEQLPAGLYFIKVYADGKFTHKKLIIK